ncbi:MAG: hypothetical protein RIR12_202 [Bacteroidota bacterium]|jgi:release factor glutamine methyltransferase
MTVQEATFLLLKKLRQVYDEGETQTMVDWVMEALTGAGKVERMMYKHEPLGNLEEKKLLSVISRLIKQEPVQYVLGYAWFSGLRLKVNKHVLIPRPETDELVDWITCDNLTNAHNGTLKILDIGTGSGCIPIAIKKKLPSAAVVACDVSTEAIALASHNATVHHTTIDFIQTDFLDEKNWALFAQYDIIVSNPPYIPQGEKVNMHQNVLAYEPHLALFVPNDDALLFYEKIAKFCQQHLLPNGCLYFEIHENFGEATLQLLHRYGFNSELKKDMQQKDRMIKSSLY